MSWTYIGAICVGNSRRDLQPKRRDSHAEGRPDPRSSFVMRQTYAVDDDADRNTDSQGNGIDAWFWFASASVPFGILVNKVISKPARIELADQTADEERYAKQHPRLRDVEVV